MIRYAVLLVAPLIIGSLIAIVVLLITGLRERRELTRSRSDGASSERAPSVVDGAARSPREVKDRRIAS
jgi:hypothetical protein